MDPAALAKLVIVGSVVLLVLSIGMAAPPGSLRAGAAKRGAIGRAMLSMFLGFPVLALALAWFLPLEPAARGALLLMAVAPMPPILPVKEQKAGAPADYALTIMIAAVAVSLIAAQAMSLVALAIFGRTVGLDGAAMAKILLVSIVLPLGVGIGIAALRPRLAARLVRPLRMIAIALLAGVLLLVLPKLVPLLLAAATFPNLAAIVLLVLGGLAMGHALAGPPDGHRRALALSTAIRHPGVPIALLGSSSLGAPGGVAGFVLLYLLVASLLTAPYVRRGQALAG